MYYNEKLEADLAFPELSRVMTHASISLMSQHQNMATERTGVMLDFFNVNASFAIVNKVTVETRI